MTIVKHVLHVYPAVGGCIAKIIMPEPDEADQGAVPSPVPFICVLDRSGSMGQNVGRMGGIVLPKLLEEIGHPESLPITLLTFDSVDELIKVSRSTLPGLKLQARGCTTMAPAIKTLRQMLTAERESHVQPLRILTISDGHLGDLNQALAEADILKESLDGYYLVNSQVVRLFTSDSQPDTRALSGMMQLSTVTASTILDFQVQDIPSIASILADLYKKDGLGAPRVQLQSEEADLLSLPWKEGAETINLLPGENVFWLKNLPEGRSFTINGSTVGLEVHSEGLTQDVYGSLLRGKIDFFVEKMKVLKVLSTLEANAEMQRILDYWTKLDHSILQVDLVHLLSQNKGLRDRLVYIKTQVARNKQTASSVMAQIANNDKVAQLNAAQSADYLRSFDVTSGSKGLAKRALASGLDFNSVALREVMAMKEHVSELDSIDDSTHHVSFYSQETTLGGILATCQLVDSGVFQELEVHDILQLLGIVGVACEAQIGPFPDPMTYRVDKVFPGCKISMADVITANLVGRGGQLEVPGEPGHKIVNVIPLFDDERIHLFLKKYAPTLLEYIASVGMRRQVAEVPRTLAYTLVSGVLSLLEDLTTPALRTELRSETFIKLVRAFRIEIGGHYDHVLPYLKPQEAQKKKPPQSFYLARNGVSNLMAPYLKVLADPSLAHLDAPIMRALYAYESWQQVRKTFRHTEQRDELIASKMQQLLQIDVEKHKTALPPLFSPPNDAPALYDRYSIETTALEQLVGKFYFADYMVLLPSLLRAALEPDLATGIQAVRNAPALDDDTMKRVLGIDYDVTTFRFYNVVLSFIYPDAADRFDKVELKSKFLDVVDGEAAEEMVRSYVRARFQSRYRQDCVSQIKQEVNVLMQELLQKMCDVATNAEFVDLFKNGMTRGSTRVIILNSASQGFVELRDMLKDPQCAVQNRAEKIKMLLMGRDEAGEAVWNNGNTLFLSSISPFKEAFYSSFGSSQDAAVKWEELETTYRSMKRHQYRELPNRHGHHNDKPSYWAMGYITLDDMIREVSEEEWTEYKTKHHDCCGIPALLGLVVT